MASAGLFESKERGTVLQRQEFHPFRNVHLRKNESIREGGKAKQKQQHQKKKKERKWEARWKKKKWRRQRTSDAGTQEFLRTKSEE